VPAQVYGTDDIRYIKARQDCDVLLRRMGESPRRIPARPPGPPPRPADDAPAGDPLRRPPAAIPQPHGLRGAAEPPAAAGPGADTGWEWAYHGDPAGPIARM
jgi:hypothetical protein